MPTHDLSTLLDSPPVVEQLLLIGAVVVGLLLWLLGRRLAKSACMIIGILVGAGIGLLISGAMGGQGWLWPLGGAIVGVVVTWLLFRIWMGITAAIMLALVAPLLVIVFEPGVPAPQVSAPSVNDLLVDTSKPKPSERAAQARAWVDRFYDKQVEQVRVWWEGLSKPVRHTITVAATVGVLVGLALGIIKPLWAASLQTSLAGTLLMVSGIKTLLLVHAPNAAAWIPSSRTGLFVVVGLITAAGVLVQCTAWRPRADKGSA